MKKAKINLWAYVPLAASLALLVILNLFYHDHWLDSDMAAEMIFSRELARTGHFFATPDWYYSTEFRFLYTHWIMGPLFHVLSDWHMIRMITNFVTYALMLGAYFFFMKPFKVKRELVAATSALLLLPFSETMMTHMVMGNTYMFHVIISFLFMGCYFRLTAAGKDKKGNKGKKGNALLIGMYLAVAVICGVSGVRYLLALQCPLVLAGFVAVLRSTEMERFREECAADNWKTKWKLLKSANAMKYFGFALLGFTGSVAGYGINIFYVCRQYVFQTYEATNFVAIYQGILLERLQNCLGSLIMLFGYIPDKGMLSLRGLISIISFVLIAVFAYCSVRVQKTEKGQRGMLSLFFLSALALNLFVFLFSTSTMVPRYFLTIYIFLLPILCFYLEKEPHFLDRIVAGGILTVCMLLAAGKVTLSYVTVDKNAEKRPVAEFLAANGYTFGYATYWNANIITELTDGRVEVANVIVTWQPDADNAVTPQNADDGSDAAGVTIVPEADGGAEAANAAGGISLEFFRWSSPKRYYEDGRDGKVFLLLTKEEYMETLGTEGAKGEVAYDDGRYVVLIYSGTSELLE